MKDVTKVLLAAALGFGAGYASSKYDVVEKFLKKKDTSDENTEDDSDDESEIFEDEE